MHIFNDMGEKHIGNTNYPFVFVHGMYGYGEDEKLNDFLPYFGMFTGSLTDYLNSQGFECYAPSVGPLSSAWDRACELYAQLFGGTVDYGVAHSKEHGHSRFGRTYEKPLVEKLGKRKPDGSINKINLIGHSFGGETIRMFTHLMQHGSKDERKATLPRDISPLFVGSKGKFIHSVITIASPHNGITAFYANRSTIDITNYMVFILGNIWGNTEFNKLYDIHLEQFDLSGDTEATRRLGRAFNTVRATEVVQGRDNIFYDLSIQGAKKMNQMLIMNPRSYYFSYATYYDDKSLKSTLNKLFCKTFSVCFNGLSECVITLSGSNHSRLEFDEKWEATDGAANTYSSLAPLDEKALHFESPKKTHKGSWYVMDIVNAKHMGIVGKVLKKSEKENVKQFYIDLLNMINSLAD